MADAVTMCTARTRIGKAIRAGVKIGAGSRSDSVSPAGKATPQTAPVRW